MSKRIIALFLIVCLLLTGCLNNQDNSEKKTSNKENVTSEIEPSISTNKMPQFDNLSDPKLCSYLENQVFSEVVSNLNSEKYFVEDVKAVYISKEYLDELAYNSQSNIYFGYTLSEIEKAFGEEKYIFTCNEDGKTVTAKYELYEDTFNQIIKNVAIGAGVILVCVTVSVVAGAAGAPAISAIFAMSAKTGTVVALESGAISGVMTAAVTGFETKDMEKTLKETVLSASEGIKIGALTGAVTGGFGKLIKLNQATRGGLTLNEAAIIQKQTGLSSKFIQQISSMDEANLYFKKARLVPKKVNGKTALVREIDLSYKSELAGKTVTNLERMKKGFAAIDPLTGEAYQLHHIGQSIDSPLAILTQAEHMGGGNNGILHNVTEGQGVHSLISGTEWANQRQEFWKGMYELLK